MTMPMLGVIFMEKMPQKIEGVNLPKPKSFQSPEAYGINPESGGTSIHATPHLFDKPDIYANIGKGQGAAAFGEGMYSATSKGVQKSYFDEFLKRSVPTVGGKTLGVPKKFLSNLSGKTIKEAIEYINDNPNSFQTNQAAHHPFKRAIQAGGDNNFVFIGVASTGGKTPYYVVRDKGFAQPAITGTGKLVIGRGDYTQVLQRVLDLEKVPMDIRKTINTFNKKEPKSIGQLLDSADSIDDFVLGALGKLPKDRYYVEPGNITAIATKGKITHKYKYPAMDSSNPTGKPGVPILETFVDAAYPKEKWYIYDFTDKHLKDKPDKARPFNSPEEAMAAWNNAPRVKQKLVPETKNLSSEIAEQVSKFAEGDVIQYKTPQYRLKHAPEETYMVYGDRLADQNSYVRDRLEKALEMAIGEQLDPNYAHTKTAWDIYIQLGRIIANKAQVPEKQGKQLASRYLNSIGIAGIKYPSSGLNNMKNPNYVHFFDPEVIETNLSSKERFLK